MLLPVGEIKMNIILALNPVIRDVDHAAWRVLTLENMWEGPVYVLTPKMYKK